MKSIEAEFLRPDALPGVNHMRVMQYQIVYKYLPCDNYSITAVNKDYSDCINHTETLYNRENCYAFICCADCRFFLTV